MRAYTSSMSTMTCLFHIHYYNSAPTRVDSKIHVIVHCSPGEALKMECNSPDIRRSLSMLDSFPLNMKFLWKVKIWIMNVKSTAAEKFRFASFNWPYLKHQNLVSTFDAIEMVHLINLMYFWLWRSREKKTEQHCKRHHIGLHSQGCARTVVDVNFAVPTFGLTTLLLIFSRTILPQLSTSWIYSSVFRRYIAQYAILQFENNILAQPMNGKYVEDWTM